ncbi:MAG TPA: YebC/PmpR family DNA-binding transcriptional regulator [Ktedonobacterales bacterium]|nr:YebC/PmpR family DNA-binding transcriptional regulator [Ktedonobacterales bacterium]HEX5572749.1 YebC/PmpR family DNA-binding transcriptional regulator [Ktedonobacterales bacterium]
MSGHSKWAQIRRQKGVNDSKRGALFTRLGREIVVAVREGGGGDPDANFRLRMAVQRARDANMPMDNIERTIKRAVGGAEGAQLDDVVYEGYAPGGAAIMVQAMTDNRNRTAAEIRTTFGKNGGNLGESGCVDWIFEQKGIFEVALDGKDPDELTLDVIDAGAEDVDEFLDGDETLIVYTDPSQLNQMREALEAKGLTLTRAETQLVPKTKIDLGEKESLQTLRLIDKLEELDDVQNVYTNAQIADEYAEKYAG